MGSYTSVVHNADCMDIMVQYPNKYFDLAVVDPPYGIGAGKMTLGKGGGVARNNNYKKKEWDSNAPPEVYFNELLRVSKNQIIWGANHFLGWVGSGWIVWDKDNGDTDYADCELAYTSFNKPVRKFLYRWKGMLQGDMKNKESRIHPTQKPVKLYDWIYKNYLPNGGNVIDTHLGSGSNRIAADKAGNINFVGVELDKDYFEAQEKRWANYKQQLTIQF